MNTDNGEMFVVKKIQLVHPFQGLDQSKVKALKHEIDRFKLLFHTNIINYYGGEITDNNVFCIYLEYMSGGSIVDLCKRYGRLGETICRQYTKQVLKALAYLHSVGVIHGDLKGANVLLNKDCDTIKLCDLGNSRILEKGGSHLSLTTQINGTLPWMAPECVESKACFASDIWSLGCLVIEMLTGENPWGKQFDIGGSVL
jgi:mitogen-activated protein kinase kinase kinase